jgi:pentose-5-phosphate-3-epimerase
MTSQESHRDNDELHRCWTDILDGFLTTQATYVSFNAESQEHVTRLIDKAIY